MASEVRDMMEAMPGAFLPEKAGNGKALIQLALTGQEAGGWVVDIAEGKCDVREGQVENPDVTVTMDAGDFMALFNNQLNPVSAFMSGKIKVAGNVGAVMQMLNWFKR